MLQALEDASTAGADDDASGLNTEMVQEQEQQQEQVVVAEEIDFGPFDDQVISSVSYWQPAQVAGDGGEAVGPYPFNRMRPSSKTACVTESENIRVSPNFCEPEYLGSLTRRLRNVTIFLRVTHSPAAAGADNLDSQSRDPDSQYLLVTLAEAEALLRHFETAAVGGGNLQVEMYSLSGLQVMGSGALGGIAMSPPPSALMGSAVRSLAGNRRPVARDLTKLPPVEERHIQNLRAAMARDQKATPRSRTAVWTFESVRTRLSFWNNR